MVTSHPAACSGSDSEVFDTEGRFVPEKFEEIFSKFDKDNKGGLTWPELKEFLKANRNLYDWFGATASILEWTVTWWLAKQPYKDTEVLPKNAIRGQYDGSLFYTIAAERERGERP